MAKGTTPKKKGNKRGDGNIEYGFMLFMQRVSQNEIAERCSVSVQTISDWKKKGNWEAKRAAKSISLEELANKCMQKAGEMLDGSLKDFNSDAFAKAIAQLKTLMPKNTVDTDIMTFMAFQDFLLDIRREESVTDEFLKKVSSYQDRYIKKKLGYND